MSSSFALCPLRSGAGCGTTPLASSRSCRVPHLPGQLVHGQPRGSGVALLDGLGDLDLELGVEQRDPANFLEIGVDGVFGIAARITARGRALPVGFAARLVGSDGTVGLRDSSRLPGPRHLDDKVLFLVGTSATPSALTRSMQVVSTSGVGSTVVQRLDQFVCVSCPLRAADGERRVEVDLRHAGRQATCAIDATTRGPVGGSTPPSSIAIADSSFTLCHATSVTLRLPLNKPRYQPVGRVAPGARILQFVQPVPYLGRLRRPGLPGVSVTRDCALDFGQRRAATAPRRSTTTTESTGSPNSGSPDSGSSTVTRRNRPATSGDADSIASWSCRAQAAR